MRWTSRFAHSLAAAALLLPGCIIFLLALPLGASALSVQWGTNVSDLASLNQSTGECTPRIRSSYASVQYSAQAYDQNGASICGGTIAKGTQVTFKPQQYASTDIYWFGTGFYGDSPYGDWIANAAAPNGPDICLAKNYYSSVLDTSTGQLQDHYGTLSVNPPAKSVGGFGSVFTCSSPASDGSVTCTASSEGSANVVFGFASTYGHFYASDPQPHNQCTASDVYGWGAAAIQYPAGNWYNAGGGRGWYICPGASANGPYTLEVPAQTLSCTVTVVNPNGSAPSAPTVTAASVSGPTQCVVGTPYTVTMTSTDSDGDQIKYAIDWDNNGTIDQFVPSSGYVGSGTAQSASRTYSLEGEKHIAVIAIDSRGLTSGWTVLTTTCSIQSDSDGGDGSGDGSGDGGASEGGGTTPTLLIRAFPSLVRLGDTTTVSWTAANVLGNSCTVNSPHDNAADGTGDWAGPLSVGVETSPIQSQTIYTLACSGLDGSVLTQSTTVSVLPVFQEN